ncbi:DUF3048 domain-containing protein [Lysobacter korlensis]|uniref:DUF3048 domain-containing protein n=1 Tax=Lysobacter korlensis TaxID=553636 RepID=A0ABV6RV90_9GAMM
MRTARLRCAVVAITAGSAMLAVAGCAEPEPAPAPTPTFVPGYVEPATVLFAPLTGTQAGTGDAAALALAGPSLAVKIDNHPAARPQVGIERADLVFEELVEGGLTRYVAVWHSDVPDEVGPVRSIRPMDPDIVAPLGGVVAYSGGQPSFVELMMSTEVVNAVHGDPGTESTFFRTPAKSAPHNLLVKAAELLAQHAAVPAPAQQFAYADSTAGATAAKEGVRGAGVALDFGSGVSRPSWAWDAERRKYLRSQDGAPDLDSSGTQLGAANVLVLRVPVSAGLGVPKTELVGSGTAWVSSGGATVKAAWSKESAAAPIRLVDQHGVVVRLAPGSTWIELLPEGGTARLVE